ncbi:MAG: acyl--CoA ligase [Xanthobacteraceae bacterium]|nr:acyl--CoA ligase [Xanthobacteraceae bacterium]
MIIDDMIAFWARVKPHQPAVIQSDMVVTYRGLADAIESVARRIATTGFQSHKPVAVAIENPAKQMAVCFALQRCGLVAAPVYAGLMPHLRSVGIEDVIYESEGNMLSGGRNVRFDNSWLPSGPLPPASVPQPRRKTSPDLIFFTSGTTGLPKKVVQTEAALIERMNICVLSNDQSYSRVLILPGLSTNFGFNRLCEVLREGKIACFALPGEGRLVLMSTYDIDRVVGSPQQILALTELRETRPGYRLDALSSVRIGGAFASRDAVKRVQASLCRNVVVEYGSTEASLVAWAPHEMIADIPDAVGFVGPWCELEIVDDAGRPLGPEQEGLIRYRTPFFIKNRTANEPQEPGGAVGQWYYPGDIGTVTANGVLCIRGRGDDVINCGGLKVSAGSLEAVLLKCTGVRDAAVCGVKGQSGLEEVWIGIVPAAGFAVAELQRELEQDAKFGEILRNVGAEVIVIDQVPRNQLGKVQRGELREKLRARQDKATPH